MLVSKKKFNERLKHLFDNLDEDQDKGILKQKIDIMELAI